MMKLHVKNKAFTLVEILIAVALTGLIAAMAFGPVIYTVGRVTETEAVFSDEVALRRAARFMAQDVTAALRLAPVIVRVISHEELGGRSNDTLIVATSAHARQNLPAGSAAYRVVRRSPFMREVPGLYRWLLPGILVEDVEYGRLEVEDAQLIVPHVTQLGVSVFVPPEWAPYYEGELPEAMKIVLTRERDGEEGESVEYVFVIPR